jgi:ABC-type multidrug transport system fused ATPase/permease subunit
VLRLLFGVHFNVKKPLSDILLVQSVIKMQKIRRVIHLTLLTIIGAAIIIINPLFAILSLVGVLTFLAVVRQLNFYKILMVIKRYAKEASKLRFEIRAKLHTGFRDYNGSLDSDESHHKSWSSIR